jgi:elongation factor 2
MPKYDSKNVSALMDDESKATRNVVILGGMGTGKTTLCDVLGARQGFLSMDQIGNRFMNQRPDEKEKGSTLKANICSMVETTYDLDQQYLFNVIDAPGHVEFSPEAQGAIRMADGAIIVVDAAEGVTVATTNFVTWCLKEHVKPVLFVNKLDKCIIEMDKDAAELHNDIRNAVEALNVSITTTVGETPFIADLTIDPVGNHEAGRKGNVVVGSALAGWAFTLADFAKIYAKKFSIEEEKMLGRLWGDHYFNAKTKKWTSSMQGADGSIIPATFEQFVMTPIKQITQACIADDEKGQAKAVKMCAGINVDLGEKEKGLNGKELLKCIFRKWLPVGDALCGLIAGLPDPKTAQKYRQAAIWNGATDSTEAKAIQECDRNGPVMMHIVKMIPTGAAGRFYCVGRVFSGTVKAESYRLQPPEFVPKTADTAEDAEAAEGGEDQAPVEQISVQSTKLQSVHCLIGKDISAINELPAGQIGAVAGADGYVTKTATLSSVETFNFTALKFVVSPIVRISVRPNDSKDLPKLVEGLKRLKKADMLADCGGAETGDNQIGGCGDEHLKLLKSDLKTHSGIEFTTGVPTVSYKETIVGVTAAFGKEENPALAKSPNKHNRLFVIAKPLDEELCVAIEKGRVTHDQDQKKRTKILCDEFEWQKTDALKIWGFGPMEVGGTGANLIVDQTKGVQYLNEIKESVNSGLLWASREGPLCEENMRGIRFNIMDVKMHADSIHRGMGQIQPTARRAFYAAMLTAMPRFQEPIFKAYITAPADQVAGIRKALAGKRGELLSEDVVGGNVSVEGYLPIVETIGSDPFTKVLQSNTSGKAFANYQMDHWKTVMADPLEGPTMQGGKAVKPSSKAYDMMLEVRKRKGLKLEAPPLEDYLDKL